jgi:hypothetical protein
LPDQKLRCLIRRGGVFPSTRDHIGLNSGPVKPNFDTFVLDLAAPAEQPTEFVEHYFLAQIVCRYCGAKLVCYG